MRGKIWYKLLFCCLQPSQTRCRWKSAWIPLLNRINAPSGNHINHNLSEIRPWIIPLDKRWQPRFYHVFIIYFWNLLVTLASRRCFLVKRGSSVDSFEKLSVHGLWIEPSMVSLMAPILFPGDEQTTESPKSVVFVMRNTHTFSFLQTCIEKIKDILQNL